MSDGDGRPPRVHRPWSVVLGAILLLVCEALYLGAGLYALVYGSWEDIAAIGTIFGLTLGGVGLLYLACTVPALFGCNLARRALVVLTVPIVAFDVYEAAGLVAQPPDLTYDAGLMALVFIGPLASTLLLLLGVVALYLPPSRPFLASRRRPS
jgi:hypothetical protein